MKTEKCCKNCIYAKISEHEDMIMCTKSIRYVKKGGYVRVAFHSWFDVCRAYISAENKENENK